MLRPSLLLLVVPLASCAAQIPAAQQEAYFSCPGIVVDNASENLQRAGYITVWREGEAAIQTQWTRRTVDSGGIPRTLFLRYVVQPVDQGVAFQIFERSEDKTTEAEWGTITRNSFDDPGTRAFMESIRRDVCGRNSGPFFASTSSSAG